MTEKTTPSARVSLALSGKMLQFNITLLVLGLLILGVLFICAQSSNPLISYCGAGIALIAFLGLILFVIYFYSKQQSRPMDGQTVAVSMRNETGKEITFQNPPDTFFEKGELIALARSMLVGYDDGLCPDGEVIGKASDQNYRRYSEEEKTQFMKRHREEIKGKKIQAARLLASSGTTEKQVLFSDVESPVDTTNA